jgi:hypothetical protein
VVFGSSCVIGLRGIAEIITDLLHLTLLYYHILAAVARTFLTKSQENSNKFWEILDERIQLKHG